MNTNIEAAPMQDAEAQDGFADLLPMFEKLRQKAMEITTDCHIGISATATSAPEFYLFDYRYTGIGVRSERANTVPALLAKLRNFDPDAARRAEIERLEAKLAALKAEQISGPSGSGE